MTTLLVLCWEFPQWLIPIDKSNATLQGQRKWKQVPVTTKNVLVVVVCHMCKIFRSGRPRDTKQCIVFWVWSRNLFPSASIRVYTQWMPSNFVLSPAAKLTVWYW